MTAKDWLGIEIDSESYWGADGPDAARDCAPERRLLTGHPAAPADTLPGALLPEHLQRSDAGLHLPALGVLPAWARLRLIGFQALNPDWDGLALAVGAEETFWVTLSAREAIHVQASATGRLAQALDCADATPEGLDDAMSRAERLPFLLGAAQTPGARMAALLGGEMAAAKGLWLGQQAVLLGQGPLCRGYLAALKSLYVPVTETSADALAREGFRSLAARFL